MADDYEIQEALRQMREMLQRMERIASQFDRGHIGSREHPVGEIYLKAKGRGSAAKITFDDANTDVLVERVR